MHHRCRSRQQSPLYSSCIENLPGRNDDPGYTTDLPADLIPPVAGCPATPFTIDWSPRTSGSLPARKRWPPRPVDHPARFRPKSSGSNGGALCPGGHSPRRQRPLRVPPHQKAPHVRRPSGRSLPVRSPPAGTARRQTSSSQGNAIGGFTDPGSSGVCGRYHDPVCAASDRKHIPTPAERSRTRGGDRVFRCNRYFIGAFRNRSARRTSGIASFR